MKPMGLLSAVYAVGLYVDPKAAKNLLNSKQAGISAKSGIPEQAIFDGRLCCSAYPPSPAQLQKGPTSTTGRLSQN